jgi:hypothetical protein
MNRYLLFAGSRYYPSGGFRDFIGSFDTIEDAESHGSSERFDYDLWQVVDLSIGQVVKEGQSSIYG